jgi:parallel beta-helix repeat protein
MEGIILLNMDDGKRITITPYNLTGLSAGTTYQFQVQTVCSAGGTSSYSATASFTTTGTSGGGGGSGSCAAPTSLASSSITSSSASVTWPAASGASSYNLQWKASSSSTWSTVSGITITPYNLTGLAAGTAYQFQVQTVCSAGGTSSYSGTASFTTSGSGTGGSTGGGSTGGTGGGSGKSYYFSSTNGDDSRTSTQAQSPSTPWKTLSKLNSFISSLQPGDNVYFQRGDIFYGSITVNKSGSSSGALYFGAYGSGNKPVITGLADVTGWTGVGTNIFESSAIASGQSTAMVVTVNGTPYPMGRWPNATDTWGGFRKITSHSGSTSISDNTLSGSPNWTGATVVIRKNQFRMEKGTVTSHSGTTLNYSSSWNQTSVSDGYGYFIENSIQTLDKQNEWYYNPSTKKLDIYSTFTPSNVKISTVTTLVNATSMSYITFDQLSFQGSIGRMFVVSSSSHMTVKNCDLIGAGSDAIYGSNASYLDVENCNITNSNHTAVDLDVNANNTTIKNNIISTSGAYPGMLDNYWLTAAVYVAGSNNTIQGNTVRKSGYLGISFAKGNNILVKNNWVDSTAFMLDEGGAIYTYRGSDATVYSNRTIDGNIITNVIGALGGKTSGSGAAAGIQMDGNSQGVSIINNSIGNVSMYGILLFNAHEITIRNNTVYNCASGTLGMVHDAGWNYIRNVAIKSNKFVMATPNNNLGNFVYQTAESDLLQFGSSDSNVVATPLNDVNAFFSFDGSTYSHRTVTQWQSYSGMDKNSKASPKTVSSLSSLRFEYNATSSSKTVSLGQAYIDIKGVSYPSSITLAPYTSAVLIVASGGTTQAAVVEEANMIQKSSLVIYPNPVRDNFVLQLNNNQTGKMNVQVVNQAGEIVHSFLFNKDQVMNQVTVPTNDLATGVYFIHVQIGTWSDRRKIVKL